MLNQELIKIMCLTGAYALALEDLTNKDTVVKYRNEKLNNILSSHFQKFTDEEFEEKYNEPCKNMLIELFVEAQEGLLKYLEEHDDESWR